MHLHNLSSIKTNKGQRVGRGGKRGTTSGRGQKGQKSRAGRRIRPAVRDLIIKIAKKRGFRNKPKSEKPFVLNLDQILPKLKPLSADNSLVITRSSLVEAGLLPKSLPKAFPVKILGGGKAISMRLTVCDLLVSQTTRRKIKSAGGSVN